MSIRDYLAYRRLEKDFDSDIFRDSELHMAIIRECKRNALKGIFKKSLITLLTIGVFPVPSLLHSYHLESGYQRIMDEAVAKSDLDGDGQISDSREMAEFYSNIPGLANYIRP